MKTYVFEVSHGYEVLKGVVDANSKTDKRYNHEPFEFK